MNPEQFAGKIREKYPGAYDALSDTDLVNKILKKYPQYKSQVTMPIVAPVQTEVPEPTTFGEVTGTRMQDIGGRIGDLPGDFMEVGKNIVKGFEGRQERVGGNIARRAEDGTTFAEGAANILDVGGATLATLADSIFQAGLGAVKATLTPQQEEMIGSTVQKGAEAVAETDTVKNIIAGFNDFAEKNPEAASNLRTAADYTQFLLDAIGLKVGVPMSRVAAETAGEVLAKAGPAVRTAGEATEAMVEGTKKVAGALKPDTTGISESLIANINRINPSKRQEFKMQQGVSEEQWLRERGIIGTREQTVQKLAENFEALRKNVDEALDQIPGNHRDPRVTVIAEDSLEFARAVESPEISRIAALADKAKGTGLTVREINELKRFYERNIKVGYMKDPTKTAEAVQLATNRDSGIRNALFEIADKNGFSNLRDINKEIQANKFLADEIAGKMEGQGANNLMTLTDWIVATPGAINPQFLGAFLGKKIFGLESVKSFAAKILAGFPKAKDLPRADLEDITRRAQEVLKKQEDLRVETEKAAVLADELQKAGFVMSDGEKAFIMENPLPLTREEQAMIRAAKNREEQLQMMNYILEQRAEGRAVGPGFTIDDIDNTPILNPRERFDPNRMERDIQIDEGPLPKASGAAAPETAGIAKIRNEVDIDALKVSAKERGYDFNKLSDEVDKRLTNAPEAKKYIDDIVENIVKDIPNTKPAFAPIKSKERILEKTILEEGGDVNNIRDIARNTIVPFDDAARSKVVAQMDARKDIFQKKVQTADKYMGYEGVLYNINAPNGLVSEIQVVTPKMTFGKNQPDASRSILGDELFDKIAKETGLEPGLGHKLYEDFRGMSIADKEGSFGLRLIEQSVDYYSKLK